MSAGMLDTSVLSIFGRVSLLAQLTDRLVINPFRRRRIGNRVGRPRHAHRPARGLLHRFRTGPILPNHAAIRRIQPALDRRRLFPRILSRHVLPLDLDGQQSRSVRVVPRRLRNRASIALASRRPSDSPARSGRKPIPPMECQAQRRPTLRPPSARCRRPQPPPACRPTYRDAAPTPSQPSVETRAARESSRARGPGGRRARGPRRPGRARRVPVPAARSAPRRAGDPRPAAGDPRARP